MFKPTIWKIKLSLIIIFALMTTFVILRLILANYLSKSFFEELSSSNIIMACLSGMRFDLSTISYLVFPILFLTFLPINSKKYYKILYITSIIISVALIIFYVSDIVFFSLFNKHITSELLASTGSLGFLIHFALTEYFLPVLLLIVILSLMIFFTIKYINNNYVKYEFNNKKNNIFTVSFILLFIFTTIVATRGSINFYKRPIRVSDAYNIGNEKIAILSLVGVYPTYEHITKFSKKNIISPPLSFSPFVKENIITSSQEILDENYPYYRKFTSSIDKFKNKNIVIIFFESWDRILIDNYSSIAKNFNNIKENSMYLPNFYATGLRSIIGVTSTFLSIPHNPLLPYLHNGLLNKNFSKVASYFNDMNYNTIFVQTDEAHQEHMDEISKYLEFKEFYAKKDIPVTTNYPSFPKGYDKEGFDFLFNKINQQKGNFLAVFYTSSTHLPYDAVLDEKTKVFEGKTQLEQYLNRVSYVDNAIGDFFQKSSKEAWFNDTIFLFLSDHNAIFSDTHNRQQDELYKNFLLIYAPKLIKPSINNSIASQEDILPTLLHISGNNNYFSSSGSSIFDENRKINKIIYSESGDIYSIKNNSISIHNLSEIYNKTFDNLNDDEKYVITNLESLYYHIINDKWIPQK